MLYLPFMGTCKMHLPLHYLTTSLAPTSGVALPAVSWLFLVHQLCFIFSEVSSTYTSAVNNNSPNHPTTNGALPLNLAHQSSYSPSGLLILTLPFTSSQLSSTPSPSFMLPATSFSPNWLRAFLWNAEGLHVQRVELFYFVSLFFVNFICIQESNFHLSEFLDTLLCNLNTLSSTW